MQHNLQVQITWQLTEYVNEDTKKMHFSYHFFLLIISTSGNLSHVGIFIFFKLSYLQTKPIFYGKLWGLQFLRTGKQILSVAYLGFLLYARSSKHWLKMWLLSSLIHQITALEVAWGFNVLNLD